MYVTTPEESKKSTNRIMEAFDHARIIEEFDSYRLIDYCDSSRIIGQRICRPNTKTGNRISINQSLLDSPSRYSNGAKLCCRFVDSTLSLCCWFHRIANVVFTKFDPERYLCVLERIWYK